MYEKEIAKGVEWLEKHDKAWYNKINLSTLCMFSNKQCVLSQFLCGDPTSIMTADWTLEHGFQLDSFEDKDCQEEWLTLKKEWTDVILEKRRANKNKSVVRV